MRTITFGLERGIIAYVGRGGENLIEPWGVEFADSSSFFSLEQGIGYRYRLLARTEKQVDGARELRMRLQLREGEVDLFLTEWLESAVSIRRRAELVCLQDCYLMDFVLRYRFRRSVFNCGSIANVNMRYDGSNVYHQFPVESVSLYGPRESVLVSVVESKPAGSMRPVMYLRSGEGAWVVHARMFPEASGAGKRVIKLCSRYFQTRPLPQLLTRLLLRSDRVTDALWYRGERKPYRNRVARVFSPNAFFMALLPRGSRLVWDVRCSFGP